MIRSCVLLAVLAVGSSLSHSSCGTHSKDDLYRQAAAIGARADERLVPSQFARVVNGYLLVIKDEQDGQEKGGSTNTEGSYTSFFFNSTEIFPEGICDIPSNPTNGGGGDRCANETAISFLLGTADAIAVVGCTPPPVRYFSYDAYIDVRTTEEYPYYVGQPFGDTVSHRTINTTGTDEDPANVFDEPMLLIHTGDGAAARVVSEAYVSSGGIAPKAVSVRQIDASTVRLWDRSGGKTWQESQPDILSMVGRMTLPEKASMLDYQKFEEQVWPVKFYFAYDDAHAKEPLQPPLLPRDNNRVPDETEKFTASMAALHEKVVQEYTAVRGASYLYTQDVNYTAEGFYDDWDVILDNKDNNSFVLDTRDALYGSPIMDDMHLVTPGCGAVAIGVIHQLAMGAAYNSVGISTLDPESSSYIESHWFADMDLEGSAARYLPNDDNARYMFAVDFMPPGMCDPDAQWCVEFNQTSYDLPKTRFVLGERVYCLQDTMIGPPADKTVSARLPIFSF